MFSPPAAAPARRRKRKTVKPFGDKMKRLVARLRAQRAEGARLDKAIIANLEAPGFRDSGT